MMNTYITKAEPPTGRRSRLLTTNGEECHA